MDQASRWHPGASRLFCLQLSHTAVAFYYSGMCKFYLVGRLRRRPMRKASRESHRLQPRNGESSLPSGRKSVIVRFEFAVLAFFEMRKLPSVVSRQTNLRVVGSSQPPLDNRSTAPL
jgi:hypothetical protein